MLREIEKHLIRVFITNFILYAPAKKGVSFHITVPGRCWYCKRKMYRRDNFLLD